MPIRWYVPEVAVALPAEADGKWVNKPLQPVEVVEGVEEGEGIPSPVDAVDD